MADEKIIIDADVKPLKLQLREGIQELQNARAKFGEFSEQAITAAKSVAEIRDSIGDAAEQAKLFDPGSRFQALTTAAGTAAAGVAAVQGAMALFGGESEDVAKAMQKVQGAMALSQGLSQLKDIGKVGEQLKGSFKGLIQGAEGFKKALISTGIGALVVAVGLLVAYWDDIKGLVSGVSGEQENLNKLGEENLKSQEEKLDAIDGQTNQLKLQGKSEKEITQMKVAQTDEAIKAAEINIENAKNTKDAQVEAAKRNKDILQGLIRIVTFPITVALAGIDLIGKAVGKNFGLEEKFSGGIANMVFDPKETSEKADKTIKEAEAGLSKLKEKRAGFQLQIQAMDKADADKKKTDDDAAAKKREEALAILHEASKAMKSKQLQEIQTIEESYAEKLKKLKEAGVNDNGDLALAKQKEIDDVNNKYKIEQAKKDADFQKELNKSNAEARILAIKDENKRAREEMIANYAQEYLDIDANEKYNADQKKALKLALKEKENSDLNALDIAQKTKKAEDDIAELDTEFTKAEGKFAIQRDLLDKKDAALKASFDAGLISEEEYNKGVDANSKARIELSKKELEAKLENAARISALAGGLADALGKETAAGKAAAVVQATIDTYLSAQKAFASMSGIPIVGPALGAVAAGVAIAGGIKNVKSILAVKTPDGGGGGGSAPTGAGMGSPNVSASAVPTMGQSPVTAIASMMKEQPPIRAFVMESEVTGSQKRVSDIERRAGF